MKRKLVALLLLLTLLLSLAPTAMAARIEGFTKAELKQALKDGDMYAYTIKPRAKLYTEKGKLITDIVVLQDEKVYTFEKVDTTSKGKVAVCILRQGYDKNRETAWYVKDIIVCSGYQLLAK